MKLSRNWLNDYVRIDDIDPYELARNITLHICELDGVEPFDAHFERIVTAKVLTVANHPDAEKLHIVTVEQENGQRQDVVCGAPNVAEGQIVALALLGCVLPDGKEVKPAEIRGVKSEGMLLSEKEMDLSDDHSGLYLFPSDTPVGQRLSAFFVKPDVVFEIDNVTITHRPDLWGHIGMARDIACLLGRDFTPPALSMAFPETGDDALGIDIQAPELCPRYSALVVHETPVTPSPLWLKRRLAAAGVRPINNLVDVTNYVMLDLAQPMHGFDRRQIKGETIVIRRAAKDEPFVTLDEQEHALTPENLVIADEERAVALGGVMGGRNSEILSDTSAMVLESANFMPGNIRRTSQAFTLATESSKRFEKSQDPENTVKGLARAVQLLSLTCPNLRVASPLLDSYPGKAQALTLSLSADFVRRRMGAAIPTERMVDILTRLAFTVKRDGETLTVGVPSFRATKDVTETIDLVEEIGRIHGLENVVPTPPFVPADPPPVNEERRFERNLKSILVHDLGYDEIRLYSMVDAKTTAACGFDPEACLLLKNSLSSDQDRLRTSLLPNLLSAVARNQKNLADFFLFEVGRTYHKNEPTPDGLASERRMLAGAACANMDSAALFFQVKGDLVRMLELLRLPGVAFTQPKDGETVPGWAHPGRVALLRLGETVIGHLAEVHPRTAKEFDLKTRTVAFELSASALFGAERKPLRFTPISRFPGTEMEFTVVVDERCPAANIERVIISAQPELVRRCDYRYTYRGEPIPQDKQAVTYQVEYRAEDRTLDGEEVARLHRSVIEALEQAGMPLRK